jgi:hypothetical protein
LPDIWGLRSPKSDAIDANECRRFTTGGTVFTTTENHSDVPMRARNNPTLQQTLRRIRRHPSSEHDPRYEKDAYWALRLKGYPHSYAKRALRDEPPKVTECEVGADCTSEDILVSPGTKFKNVEVPFIRPVLTAESLSCLASRQSEYTVWDGKISGFGLRIRPSGHKTFILLYRVRGQKKLQKITIGRAESIEFDTARGMAQEFLSIARMGHDPAERFRSAQKLNRTGSTER